MTSSDLAPRRLAPDLTARPLGISSGTSRWAPTAARPQDARLLAGLRRALHSGGDVDGVQLLDTADSHRCGHAERLVGKVLKEHPGHKVQVASKVGRVQGSAPHPYAGPRVRHQLEQTLENLYLDQLAIYTLESYDFGRGDRYLDPVVEQMQALRDLGQIRAIGLRGPGSHSSQRSIRRFLDLFDRIRPDVLWTQASGLLPLADLGESEDLGAFAVRHGVGLVIASPLAHGVLAGGCVDRALAAWPSAAADRGAVTAAVTHGLAQLAGMFGSSPPALARVALRSLLQRVQNAVLVIGVDDEQQHRYDRGLLGRPLSEQELAAVDEVFARVRSMLFNPEERAPSVEAIV
ncbi:aryl-alcohol dehydrogenase-like predicted oxidoreductase [Streptomyces sp. KhCrAH-43]|uniref:aldo/keto reductase n=1 Tax=unclassified Streptomyces TaxID=2593676 RepID=UPI00035FBDB8|nr:MULTISPECIES: aldo/keto reductase [unclassified Streptomyces]MYS33620.1 aldo/keto reductase [Streptomyces sp. SID4920]MYX63787.1 aldo/keto reductase [Streptomyces sp. SID8373]RAJ52861.1 aryl-alcohol dehydrogenase-like predicted oxidoreductase [Streptomyces sp. KhCrAH-43]